MTSKLLVWVGGWVGGRVVKNYTNKKAMSINSGCLSEVIGKTETLGTGGSKTVDFGIGLLSKLGMEFISNLRLAHFVRLKLGFEEN